MMLIDERGRLFGRINLIDAAVGLVVLVLIPIAYGAFLLFRAPVPKVTAIEPSSVVIAQEMRVKLRGDGLRPLLRVFIGDVPASAYLYENDQSADVLFSRMPPGSYDVRLFDGVQEVARIPAAVKVVTPAQPLSTSVEVTGVLVALDPSRARQLAVGQRFPATGPALVEIVALGAARPDVRWIKTSDVNVALPVGDKVQVPVVLRMPCEVRADECRINDVPIGPRVTVTVPGTDGSLNLLIDNVRPDVAAQLAELLVRFIARPEVIDLVKVGDRDSVSPAGEDRSATISSLGGRQILTGETAVQTTEASGLVIESRAADRFAAVDVALRLGLDPTPLGWRYRGQPVKVGAPIAFATADYQMRGSIVRVTLLQRLPGRSTNGTSR